MDYKSPDEAEKWLRENDPNFGKGERPYLSQWQVNERKRKEFPYEPKVIDEVDFGSVRIGNYGTIHQKRMLQKDRHKRGHRDSSIE